MLNADQQAMVREIFDKLHSDEYKKEVWSQFDHDNKGDGGFPSASIALFGEPGTGQFEFVLTGRHCTRRCDGDSEKGAAFGGPIFYGHAAGSFNEKPDLPGNVYWYQAKRANEVLAAFDGKQREAALLGKSRQERGNFTVELTGKKAGLEGIRMSDLGSDQKDLVRKVIGDLLKPFREHDAKEAKVRATSPAGIKPSASMAWYQRLSTYSGEQDSFHRLHLVTGMAKEFMNFSCNTCHQGNDPRDEAPGASATGTPQTDNGFTLRKAVNVETTCLKCHAPMNAQIMGLPSPWPESKEMFGDSCLTCHAAIRTQRHQVSYLKAEAIEAAGQKNADVCYACHGGRAWYRTMYPYPRHPWEGMAPDVPDWAKDRPVASEARFALPTTGNQPRQ